LIQGKAGIGTGFLVAPGLVATNAHVIGTEMLFNIKVQFLAARRRLG
jgi:hypothetical protein